MSFDIKWYIADLFVDYYSDAIQQLTPAHIDRAGLGNSDRGISGFSA
jgi:hypothetical protein